MQLADTGREVLIPAEAAHQNGMMSPALTG
jgi:hypothetical protein